MSWIIEGHDGHQRGPVQLRGQVHHHELCACTTLKSNNATYPTYSVHVILCGGAAM